MADVKIIVDNTFSKIQGILSESVQRDLDNTLSYRIANSRFIPQVKSGAWDGVIRLYFKVKGQSFYTGLMSLVRDTLTRNNVTFEIVDRRIRPDQNYPELQFTYPEGYTERDYQTFTINRALKFSRGVLSLCTGAGKTVLVSRLIGEIKTYPFMFYVLTKDLMEQAHEELTKHLNQPIGMIGDSKCDIKKITICTIQTAVMALNQGNTKFKISDYIYDDEETWDEKSIDSAEKLENIKKLIQQTKGLYMDECISGDSKIITEKGEVAISEVANLRCHYVKSHDEYTDKVIYKPILNWWNKGARETLKITIANKNIVCTKEHPIYTARGWVNAGELLLTDKVFCDVKDWKDTWQEVNEITDDKKQEVYDIEVEDTHCFFANGILVHNCHHTAAKTCKEVLLASPNAYWRFGGSATPNRESGDDIMIQAVFGAKIVDISASYLIKKNWLVKPYIFFEPVITDVNLHSYQKVYYECVVKNDPLNDHIADTANHLVKRGLSVLVLVQQYAHGDYLKSKIPGSEFMTGRLTSAKRTQILDDMRSGKLKVVIASSLADEGLNVPTLDAVLLAGCGKSSTRLFQRIGRTLRKDKAGKKNKSIVIVYDHNAKYLSKHVKRVKTLLKKEEEFVVRSSAGEKFILKELDDLLGFKNDTKSVFE